MARCNARENTMLCVKTTPTPANDCAKKSPHTRRAFAGAVG